MKNKIIISFIIVIFSFVILRCFLNKGKNKQEEFIENNQKEVYDIFENYHDEANKRLESMTIDEKIGQIFLVRYPEEKKYEVLEQYKIGGYLFFEKDFREKSSEDIKIEIENLQKISEIPLLIAVDEEGGKVVRVSSNQNLVQERFKSPSELYNLGGFEKIKEDTIEKSTILYDLGVNLNLAPVVDVSTNPDDYIYPRTIGQDTDLTSRYAKTVIEASKEGKVSYTLKHFPGYGNNLDTHKGTSIDDRKYEEIVEDAIVPFREGIRAGAEAVLISHNVIKSIDKNNPASLSKPINELLREELGFRGVIITDDLDMGAVSSDEDRVVKAILAGNDLIIVTDYAKSFKDVKKAIEDNKISEDQINNMAKRIIEWKLYKKMI